MRQRCLFLVAVATSLFVSQKAFAATCTWQSTSDQFWSTAANWSCGHAPLAFDDAVFPAGATLQTAVNQDVVPQATVNSMNVTGGAWAFTGKTISVTSITNTSPFSPIFVVPIKLLGNATFSSLASAGPLVFQTGGIDIGPSILTLSATSEIDVKSVISGSGSIVSSGAGLVVLDGVNTYTGITTINAGTVRVTKPQSLGSNTAGTSVTGAGSIATQGTFSIAEPLSFTPLPTSPGLVLQSGSVDWSGPITLGAKTTVNNATAGTLELSGAIGGVGTLLIKGTTLQLSGANTFTGGTIVTTTGLVTAPGSTPLGTGPVSIGSGSGLVLPSASVFAQTFQIFGPSGLQVTANGAQITGAVTVEIGASIDVAAGATLALGGGVTGPGALTKLGAGDLSLSTASSFVGGATIVNAGKLTLTKSDVLPDDVAVTIAAGASLVLASTNETVSSLSGSGAVDLGAGKLTFGNGKNQTFAGAIGGTGSVVVQGSGTKAFTGKNTFTGPLQATAGTLSFTNTQIAANVSVTGATLTSAGTSTGTLTLDATSTFTARTDTGLLVKGTVNLGNAKLDLAFASEPAIGDILFLIDDDGNDPIVGTFAGLPEGAVFTAGGVTVKITYAGGGPGSGDNNVILTVVDPTMITDAGVDAGETPDAGDEPDAAPVHDAGGNSDDNDAGTKPVPTTDAGGSSSGAHPIGDAGSGADASANAASVDTTEDGGCSMAHGNSSAMSVFFLAALAGFVARKRRGRR